MQRYRPDFQKIEEEGIRVKIFIQLVVIGLILGSVLIGCGIIQTAQSSAVDVSSNNQANNNTLPREQIVQKEIVQLNSSGNYGRYDMSGEFINAVDKNPIDHDYDIEWKKLDGSKNFSTQAEIELEEKYTKIWDNELNAVYKKLLSKLNPKERDVLIESQKGWLEYHLKESEFVNQTFYLRESGPIFGTQGRVSMQVAFKGRLRERTLELMEYYVSLGGKLEFMYKSTQN